MARKNRTTDKENIEIDASKMSRKQVIRRVIIIVLLVAVAAVSFASGLTSYFSATKGWNEITVSSSIMTGEEFTFVYNLGAGDVSANTENKAITSLYTSALETTYQLFNVYEEYDDVVNLKTINDNPNQELVVDDILYSAFERLLEADNRYIYLGPIYYYYDYVFSALSDYEASQYDHMIDEVLIEETSEIMEFVNSEDDVYIELLADNTIILHVSEEYMNYIEEHELSGVYIDFYWMKNAFITDYVAEIMIENGYTNGVISSYDGYTRCLDTSGDNSFVQNVYALDSDGEAVLTCLMTYSEPYTMVRFQNFSTIDYSYLTYTYEDGTIRTRYLSMDDASSKYAITTLIGYSESESCVDIMLELCDLYIDDELDTSLLTEQDLYYIYVMDNTIYYNDSTIVLSDYADEYSGSYISD